MNTKKLLCSQLLPALFAVQGLLAFTATFTESDKAYDWSDSSIWDVVPNASGSVVIDGAATSGSSINIDGLDLSAYGLKTSLSDATLNIINGASYNVGAGGDLSLPANRTLELLGNSKFLMSDSTLTMGDFCSFFGSGTSEIVLTNSTVNAPYAAFNFSDKSKFVLDATSYEGRTIWSDIKFANSAQLNLQNGAKFGFVGLWDAAAEIVFSGDSQANILSGSTFSTYNSGPIYLEDNVQINLSGLGSTLNALSGVETRTSESGAAANVKINVTNGATFSASSLVLTGTSSLNFTSQPGDENPTSGSLTGLSLVDKTSINISGAQTTLSATGTYTGVEGTTLNVSDGALFEKGATSVTLAGDIVANVSDGARFNMGHRDGLYIQDNAKLVVDGAYLGLANYPVITASGGELVFKNGATLTGNDTTSTVGRYGHFNFSGNSKLTMQDTSISVGMVCDNYDDNSFSGTSSWTLDSASFNDNGFGTFANGLKFSNSASLVLKNSSSLTWKSIEGATVSVVDSASIDISGYSTLNAYELSVGGDSGQAKLILQGSGNSVTVTSKFSLIGASGTSIANQMGGMLRFVADIDGVSSIDIAEISEFSGLIELDFSAFSQEGTFEYVLISSASDWSQFGEAYKASSDSENSLVNVTKANKDDSWLLDFVDNNLVLTYTHVVPEPASVAMIFGAAAMALALARRRFGSR